MSFKILRYIIGNLMQIESVLLLVPAITAAVYKESKMITIFFLMVLICQLGGIFLKGPKDDNITIFSSDGYVVVAAGWLMLSLCSAIPLYLSGYFPNFVDALFEIVSGFTTTGATILPDVEILPRSILMWRSFSHWIGGMGVLVFMLAIIPMGGASSMYLMKAESPGPSVGKLVPKVRSTAKILYAIYFFLTMIQMLLLVIAGCPIFDSINLALATAGTGGFAVLNSSCADYNTAVQIILTVFMILFGVNFDVYFLIYTKHIKDAFKCEEARVYLGIIFVASALITINTLPMYESLGSSILHSVFQVASIITTTGFATVDFDLWPEFSRTIVACIMFFGACAGSTAGGIKVSRIIIMVKTIFKELAFLAHPRNVRKVRLEGKQVEHDVLRSVNVFLISYLAIFMISILIVSLDNFDGVTNFTAVSSALNNIGPGLNKVGPTCNFSAFSNLSKLVMIFDMLAGRLEIFPMLMLVTMWRNKKRWG